MVTTRHWRPQVEPLEDRLVLSGGHGQALHLLALKAHHKHHRTHHHATHHGGGATGQNGTGGAANPATAQQSVALNGQVSGTWDSVFAVPDVGGTQELRGTGTVAPLGAVYLSGQLLTPGFVAQGRAMATLTLTNSAGSVTLQLVGPPQPGFSQPPASFQYTITGGTGAYAHASGSGTATLTETPEVRPVCPPGTLCPDFIVPGSFTLVFQAAAA
jgi:hypothetical protein